MDLPAAHAVLGSDTTVCYFGIGKGTVVKVLRTKTVSLPSVGDLSAHFNDVLRKSTHSVAACYNVTPDEHMNISYVGQKVWASRVGKAQSCAPKLCSLPPTSETFSYS